MNVETGFEYKIITVLVKNKKLPTKIDIIKNVSSSTSHKKNPSFRLYVFLYGNLRKFFLTLSFMNRF